MLFFLLAGCGLFHELEPWASDDTGRTVITDTGTVITDTGTGVTTDTGTAVTETGGNLPSVRIALYAMTIRDNGPINIETYDIATGMNADSSPTSLSGSSGASNGLILTTDNRLFATGNGDSLLEGFSIDDQTGLLNVEGWSPFETGTETLHTISEKDGVLYGVSDETVASYLLVNNGIEARGEAPYCIEFCEFIDVSATLDGSHFAATANTLDGAEGTILTGSYVLNDINDLADELLTPMGNIASSRIENIVYASTNQGVAAIRAQEGEPMYLGYTGSGSGYSDIAVSVSGNMGFGVMNGFGGSNWSLHTYKVSQGGTMWQDLRTVEAPSNTKYISVSHNYIALSSNDRIWVYVINSDGYPDEHFLEFTRQGQNYFGPIVILEGAGGN